MFLQPEKIEFKTEIPQTKLFTGFGVSWETEESYLNKSFLGSVSLRAGAARGKVTYWSEPEQKQTKTTIPGVVVKSNGHTNTVTKKLSI